MSLLQLKATNWDKLMDEFTQMTENMVGVNKAQVIRKWHNWKQYNKQHGKPHPFVVVGDVVVEDIIERVAALISQAKTSPGLARYLSKGGEAPFALVQVRSQLKLLGKILHSDQIILFQPKSKSSALSRLTELGRPGGASSILPFTEKVKKLRTGRDFRVRRTGVSAMTLTVKKLEHEIALESLNYEQERWRVKVANNKLVGEKLQRQHQLAEMKLEQAKIQLAMKQQQCASMNIPLPN